MNPLLITFIGFLLTLLGVVLTKLFESFWDKRKQARLFIADIDDVLKWNWTGKELLRNLIGLDYMTTEHLNERNEGTPEQWAPIFMDNPESWKLLAVRKGEIVGYYCFLALKDDLFQKVKQGLITDSEITADQVMSLDKPGFFNIYIDMFCVREHYRTEGVPLLFNSFINQINELTSSGVIINEVVANSFTDAGAISCKSLGLKKEIKHFDYGMVYCGTYKDMCESKRGKGKLKLAGQDKSIGKVPVNSEIRNHTYFTL